MSKKSKEKRRNDWETLNDLIAELERCARADEMKGGGDPDAFEIIELEYRLANEKLNYHIRYMQRLEE